jgi:hypothetical protein
MAVPNITTVLASEDDAPALASIMTAAMSSCDAAYPLIWGSAPEGLHDKVAVEGLFTPVIQEGRVTFKAVEGGENGKLVAFAMWNLPNTKAEVVDEKQEEDAGKGGGGKKKGNGLPDLPDVNMELWSDKMNGLKEFYLRDVEPSTDVCMSPTASLFLSIQIPD